MDLQSEEAKEAVRKRRTLFLVVGGTASLLLPLLGVIYLKITDKTISNNLAAGAAVFDRRDGTDAPRIAPAGLPSAGVSAAQSGGTGAPGAPKSGLAFVYTNEDIARDPPPPSTAPVAAAAAAPPPPEPQKSVAALEPKPAKNQARQWTKPSLQASPFSTNTGSVGGGFGGRGSKFSGGSMGASQQQQGQGGPVDPAAAMAAMGAMGGQAAGAAPGAPPGGGAMPAGMPDIGAMMKGMPSMPGAGGAGAPGGAGAVALPDVGAMLKGIPGMPTTEKK